MSEPAVLVMSHLDTVHPLGTISTALPFRREGDKVYGPDETLYLKFIEKGVTTEMLDKLLLPRHALHAERVSFLHPTTRQRCTFEAPLPEDMRTFIEERA